MDEIKDRSFTYRGQIKVSKSDLRLAKAGRKTCTIRFGTAMVQGDEIDLTDGRDRIRVRILAVDTHRPYADITDEEARADGVDSLAALDADLRRFYGRLHPDQPMTLIHFAINGEDSASSTQQPELW
jgi:hypothetical protein